MTDGGAKEWVTVKLPKEVRDAAQDDQRTYGEIMRAGLEALHADLVAVRSDGDIELRKADEPIANTPAADGPAVDAEELADAVAARGVSLDAAEHRAIAEEVVGMLR